MLIFNIFFIIIIRDFSIICVLLFRVYKGQWQWRWFSQTEIQNQSGLGFRFRQWYWNKEMWDAGRLFSSKHFKISHNSIYMWSIRRVCIAPVYFYLVKQQRHQQQQMTCLEKRMTYLQTATQRSLQLQASPWYLIQDFLNLFFSESLAKPLWADPYYYGSLNHAVVSKLSSVLCLRPGYWGWDGGGAGRRGACTWNSHRSGDSKS